MKASRHTPLGAAAGQPGLLDRLMRQVLPASRTHP
jgi:hypothetical protein